MSLIDQIRADILQITTNTSEFGAPIVFESPTGQIVTVNGRTNKHHLAINGEGAWVNSKTASVSVSEQALLNAGYIVRDDSKQVSLRRHKVSWVDSTGQVSTYLIGEAFPDETMGLIVCIIGDFK